MVLSICPAGSPSTLTDVLIAILFSVLPGFWLVRDG
jgi:hypothetical protein